MLNILDRDHGLIVHSRHPYNAEPTPERLRAQALTPARDFYIRSHGSVPRLDAGTCRLAVGGRVRERPDLSLVVRAWDGAGQTQPSRPEDVWNFKGYLSAAWHRVTVTAA